MTHLRELNNANTAKIMTETFGHSNIFATLSPHALTASPPLSIRAHTCANIRLSLQKCKGSLVIFCPYTNYISVK